MTSAELRCLLEPDRQNGVLLDTNLLLLLWVGRWRLKAISEHKRTQQFDRQDFALLEQVVATFQRVIVTPCILAESSNLIRQTASKQQVTATLPQQIETLIERHIPSIEVVHIPAFVTSGLTDAGVVALARERWLVLTVDFGLVCQLQSEGLDVVNFNHLRLSQT